MTKKKANPQPGGRKPHNATPQRRKLVQVLAGYGIPTKAIAQVLGISTATLYQHYRQEIDQGAAMVEAQLVGNLLRMSNGRDATALRAIIFSLQSRFGWSPYTVGSGAGKDEPLGKKAAANEAALTAHEGTEWSQLVN